MAIKGKSTVQFELCLEFRGGQEVNLGFDYRRADYAKISEKLPGIPGSIRVGTTVTDGHQQGKKLKAYNPFTFPK